MSDTVNTPNRQRRFWFLILGAVILVAILTGATTTHIIDHDMLADHFTAPIELVLAGIAALTHWPADWREPLVFGLRMPSPDSATDSHSSIGHLPSSSSVKGMAPAIPPISSGDQLDREDRVGNLVHPDQNRGH